MNFPDSLRYTPDHEWIRVEGSEAVIGITDFAQHELGDIVYVEIESLNKELNAHEIFGTVEAVKTVSDLFLPVSGKVLAVNPKLSQNPDSVNKDPYGEGWMIRISLREPQELNGLLDAAKYRTLTGQ